MRKSDFLIYISVLLCIVFSFGVHQQGDTVCIYLDSALYKKLPLKTDCTIKVKGKHGENTVCIQDGRVFLKDSSCPSKLCEKTVIKHAGQSILCIPNRLSVTIEGKNKEADVIL